MTYYAGKGFPCDTLWKRKLKVFTIVVKILNKNVF